MMQEKKSIFHRVGRGVPFPQPTLTNKYEGFMIQHKQKKLMLIAFVLLFLSTTAVITVTAQTTANHLEANISQPSSSAPQAVLACPSPLAVMPVGDSITYGIGSTGAGTDGTGGGYRKPLLDTLNTAGININYVGSQTAPDIPGFDNEHEGLPGVATDAFANGILSRLRTNHADIVLIHLGTNDVSINDTDPTTDLDPLLDKIDQYESEENVTVTVILAQIINRPCDLANPSNNCDIRYNQTSTLNDNIAALVQSRVGDDIRLVNMEDDAGFSYAATSADFSDDKHPSNAGYAKMAAVWFNELTNRLSQRSLARAAGNPGLRANRCSVG